MDKLTRIIKGNLTVEKMKKVITAAPMRKFKKGDKIYVNDKMQKYSYILTESPGRNFREDFTPYFTPKKMLELGVFEGKYMNDCLLEFPKEWFVKALAKGKLSPEKADPTVNMFKIKSRLSLQEWLRRHWIPCHKDDHDVRGWFQWYCRYWMGRRIPEVDDIQIGRWKKFRRHFAQVEKNAKGDLTKRPRQRQALLQWAWNCYI